MGKQQRKIEEFDRIRLGKPETVCTHTRTYDIKPKLDKKTEDKIKHGKAKRLTTESEFRSLDKPIQIQMDLYSKPTKDAFTKELNKTMKEIVKISEIDINLQKQNEIRKKIYKNDVDFDKNLSGWSVRKKGGGREERIKPDPDRTKIHEIYWDSIRYREHRLTGNEFFKIKKETDPKKREKLKKEISHLEEIRDGHLEKLKTKQFLKDYYKRKEKYQTTLKEPNPHVKKFFTGFIDDVNKKLEEIEKKEEFNQFYLSDDLKLNIQKNEPHYKKVNLPISNEEVEVCIPLKNYTFEELNPDLKKKVIKILKEEFKKNYPRKQNPKV